MPARPAPARRSRCAIAMPSSPRPRPRARRRCHRQDGRRISRARRARIGREIEVFTIGQIVCRATQKEAEDYYRHAIDRDGRLGLGRPDDGDQEPHAADARRQGVRREAHVFRLARDRRLSVRRHTRQHRRRTGRPEPLRCARHRLLDGQLSATSCRCSATRCCRGWSGSACAPRTTDTLQEAAARRCGEPRRLQVRRQKIQRLITSTPSSHRRS